MPLLSVNVDEELKKRLELFRKDMSKQQPGFRPTMSDAVRVLLERALASKGKK